MSKKKNEPGRSDVDFEFYNEYYIKSARKTIIHAMVVLINEVPGISTPFARVIADLDTITNKIDARMKTKQAITKEIN